MFSVLKDKWNIPEVIADNDFVILQFGTKTCTPCFVLSQKLELWSKAHPEVTVIYVPTESFLEDSVQMGVLSSPTILTYIGGQLYQEESGYFSLEQVLERMEKSVERYRNSSPEFINR